MSSLKDRVVNDLAAAARIYASVLWPTPGPERDACERQHFKAEFDKAVRKPPFVQPPVLERIETLLIEIKDLLNNRIRQ